MAAASVDQAAALFARSRVVLRSHNSIFRFQAIDLLFATTIFFY
jgi:hypothetical protein